MVGSVKAKREEFKAQFELDKEVAKTKIAETKATFKENLAKIKDENKKKNCILINYAETIVKAVGEALFD